MDQAVAKIYGNKVRVRACGLCWDNDGLLMVNHAGITPGDFWAPPGGGVEFGQTIEAALKKEFREETGLAIRPEKFLFGCEYIGAPIHSIEIFYNVAIESGQLKTGCDPEIQIIKEVRFMSFDEIRKISDPEVHGIFRLVGSVADLRNLRGFFTI
jgi:8-oxo-dGTP diphosphatase